MAKRKKSGSKKSTVREAMPAPYKPDKNVNIKKASNGYVVSTYTENGEKTLVAKTKQEANKMAARLLS